MSKVLFLVALVVLPGCASNKLDLNVMNKSTVDCTNKEEQIKMYQSQLPSPNERLWSTIVTNSIIGTFISIGAGTYEKHRQIRDHEYDAVARDKIHYLRTYCS